MEVCDIDETFMNTFIKNISESVRTIISECEYLQVILFVSRKTYQTSL